MSKLKILLADDHPVLRWGLRALIDAQPDMQVVAEVGDGGDLAARVISSGAQLAIIDVAMPKVGGVEATAALLRVRSDVKVLALSAHEDRGHVEQMLAAGASGYLSKGAAAEDLVRAIRCVADGQTYIDPVVAGELLARTLHPRQPPPDSPHKLSDREADVLRLIACGHTVKDIATNLGVGVRSVETYRSRAMEKAGLRSRADVVRFAAQRGWLIGV